MKSAIPERLALSAAVGKTHVMRTQFIVDQNHPSSIKTREGSPTPTAPVTPWMSTVGPFLAGKMWMMSNKKKIAANLQSALSGQRSLSIDLYVEVLASYEDELRASLEKDADDALLCMLDDDGDVAMMVIDWDGSIYRNEHALKKLRAMWRQSFETNVLTLVPILSTHISQKNLGVAGIKWLPGSTD